MTQSLPGEVGVAGELLPGLEQPHPCLPVPKLPLEAKCLSTALHPWRGGRALEGCGLTTATTTKGMCQNTEPSCY